ncbi:MAG: hypothetical protein RL272_798 [Candidatus Parcubacteria bacterium]|jgi:hypothetical protein
MIDSLPVIALTAFIILAAIAFERRHADARAERDAATIKKLNATIEKMHTRMIAPLDQANADIADQHRASEMRNRPRPPVITNTGVPGVTTTESFSTMSPFPRTQDDLPPVPADLIV